MRASAHVSMHHMSATVVDGRKFKDYTHADEIKSLCLPLHYYDLTFFIIHLILLPSWGVSVFIKINLLPRDSSEGRL